WTPARYEQSLDWGAKRLLESLHDTGYTVPPDKRAAVRKAVGESLSYGEAVKQTANTFAARFSSSELKELTAFYASPIGQRALLFPALLNTSGSQIGQLIAQRIPPKLRELGLALPDQEKTGR